MQNGKWYCRYCLDGTYGQMPFLPKRVAEDYDITPSPVRPRHAAEANPLIDILLPPKEGLSAQENDPPQEEFHQQNLTWADIYQKLRQCVIGQDKACRNVASILYQHMIRIQNPDKRESLPRTCTLIYGPSGCGKTELFRAAAEILDIPVLIADATQLTCPGYRGLNIGDVFTMLYEKAGRDMELAKNGILFLDEFDKIACAKTKCEFTEFNTHIMFSTLKVLEGDTIQIPPRPGDHRSATIPFDTSNLLFVLGGAHGDIKDTKARSNKTIGFSADFKNENNTEGCLKPHDFIKYGYPRELIGRLQNYVEIKDLSIEDLVSILTEPEHSIVSKYRNLAELIGGQLEFEPGALESIAERGKSYGIGARGIQMALEEILRLKIAALAEGSLPENIITVTLADAETVTVSESLESKATQEYCLDRA